MRSDESQLTQTLDSLRSALKCLKKSISLKEEETCAKYDTINQLKPMKREAIPNQSSQCHSYS